RENDRDDQALTQRGEFGIFLFIVCVFTVCVDLRFWRGNLRGVSRLLDLGDESGRGQPGWGCDLRLLRGVVDGGGDSVELVEFALDARRARRAGHTADLELDAGHVVCPRGSGADGRVAGLFDGREDVGVGE